MELTKPEIELLKTFIQKGGRLIYGLGLTVPTSINIEVAGIVDEPMLTALKKTSFKQFQKTKNENDKIQREFYNSRQSER